VDGFKVRTVCWFSRRSTAGGKPLLVKALGAGVIVVASLMILMSLSGIVVSLQLEMLGLDISQWEMPEEEMPVMIELFIFVFKNSLIFALLMTAYSIVMLVSGIFFLLLKTWAKILIEIILWIAVIVIGIVALLWIFMWLSGPTDAFAGIFGALMGLFFAAFFASIPVIGLVLIRNRTVKEAFSGN
jgi:hypothetical protein